MEQKILSIIVPFYEMGKNGLLHYCMDSLLKQDLDRPYEILAVDDSSKDNTYERLKEYEQNYPEKVRALRTPYNMRQGGARNIGLDHAKGTWIGFMDGDDWAAPDMFRKLIDKAEMTGADMVGCDLHETHEHSMKIGQILNANTMDQTGVLDAEKYKKLILNPCSMVIKIYRRDVIEQQSLRFPEGIFYEDNCAGPIWMLSFKHFEKVEEPLYYYYQQENSTTHQISEEKCKDRMKAGELLIEQAHEYGLDERYPAEFEFAFTKLYYVNTLFTYLIGIDHRKRRFLEELKQGLIRHFPDFRNNPYYDSAFDEEQKKMVRIHMRSSLLFLWYYRLLMLYRQIRYGKKKR